MVCTGIGTSIKEAQKNAAANALKIINKKGKL